MKLTIGLLLVLIYLNFVFPHDGLPDHFPKYLQSGKYGQAFGGVKTIKTSSSSNSGRKTFTKTSRSGGMSGGAEGSHFAPQTAGHSYQPPPAYANSYARSSYQRSDSFSFKGGCTSQPKPALNSVLNCNPAIGCNITCLDGYRLPDGRTKLGLKCINSVWTVDKPAWLSYGVSEQIPVACEAICSPVCLNNGICYEPDKCNCPDNFSGARCENSRRPCLNYPQLPSNARRTCSTTTCTVSCLKGHEFPDGSAITSLRCVEGSWEPTRKEWAQVPDCQPTCNPVCQNGGNCLSLNVCHCPQDYRGPQCQYRADACSVKRLNFNGGYNCSGDHEKFSCSIKCPAGVEFASPPAALYTCMYATGVFKPQPVPQCLFGALQEAVPHGADRKTYYETVSIGKQSGSGYNTWIQPNLINDSLFVGSASYTLQKSLENQVVSVQQKTPEFGTCFTWGGAHFKTFDGAVFSALSTCPHLLVRDAVDSGFSVSVQHDPKCTGATKCARNIRIYLQDKEFLLTKEDAGPVLFTGKKMKKRVAIPGQVSGLRTKFQGDLIVVTLDQFGLIVKWDGAKLVRIEASRALWNRTEGLCGRLDGDKDNDMTGRDGETKKTVSSLMDSWKMQQLDDDCGELPSETSPCGESKTNAELARSFCTQLLSDGKFKACHEILDYNLLLDSCLWDFCACEQETNDGGECACDTMTAYVKECRGKGVKETGIVRWRTDNICPLKCTGGRVYKSCGPTGGFQATCGDSQISEDETDPSRCEEGCFCPLGTVFHEGKCIEPENCPCKLRGKVFQPGEQIPKECNSCTCQKGLWKCSEVQCRGRCSAIGDPHYSTFDGKKFDFMGKCAYYLLKADNFSIEAENVACPGAISQTMGFPVALAHGMPSCTKTVTVRTSDGHRIKLKQNREVTVNGHDVDKFPHFLDNDVVRIASSLFVVVELENGVEVWWDGISRVYVDVSADFRDKTQGLCGTFNSKQKDDFLTPEGDVETSAGAFANKWKTDELCEDVKTDVKDHPCEVNVQRKAKAEELCGSLLTETFNECHWFVDPQPFYDNCLYDLCSCELKVSQCLCPILAAYAKECSALGAVLEWRRQVPQCGVQCPTGQSYQTCGSSCQRSCLDIAMTRNCEEQCVEGCNCLPGETLDEHGECAPIGLCPCYVDGLQFPPGYVEIRSALLTQEKCKCENASWSCVAADKSDLSLYPKSAERATVCSASKHQEFTTCEPAAPATCRNMHDSSELEFSTAVCRPGCRCQRGYVLRDAHLGEGQCVLPHECPCHHGGRSYAEGESMQNDCNNCSCTEGKWTCTQQKCAATCSVWGDSHFKSFDGRTFDFQGQCDYVFAKGALGKHDAFEVTVQSVPCGTLGVSCSRSVSVSVGGETLTLTRGKEVPQHATMKRMALRQTNLFVFVEIEDLGLTLMWDRGTRVYLRAATRWQGRIKGLCGNYNDDEQDDFQTPAGGVPEVSARLFGDSWRLETYCPPAAEVLDTCALQEGRRTWSLQKCGVLKAQPFATCHAEVPVGPYLDKCVFDSCACDQGGDCECLCTALAAYATECATRGVIIQWRHQELCPMQCDENCAKYSPCMSSCPVETCDNLLTYSQLSRLCGEEPCVEGCAPKACPPGQLPRNASATECMPRATCKPICMQLDGILYSEGDLMEEDECHKCFCSKSKKICSGKPCTLPTGAPPPNDSQIKCQNGWTQWVNQDQPKSRQEKQKGKRIDLEPLPTALLLNSLPSGGRCAPEDMRDIQCRTVEGQIDPKATGLDVECSLERGLICKSNRKGKQCPDFEIRTLCGCEPPPEGPPAPLYEQCDPNTPNRKHPDDCHLFEQCLPTETNSVWIEKTCGPNMWYNPETMICDWFDSVRQVRKDCDDLETIHASKPIIAIKRPSDLDAGAYLEEPSPVCPPDYVYSQCGTECLRLCLFYSHAVRQKGLCLTDSACEAGCIYEKRELSCPPGFLWRDNSTCVRSEECLCRSHDGQSVKPGTIYRESECEFCQCIDNHYSCDRSACVTTVPTTEPHGSEPVTSEPPPQRGHSVDIPPPLCDENRYSKLLNPDADWPLSDAAFSASSIADEAHQPWHSRLGGKLPSGSAGSWSPAHGAKNPHIQVDLGRSEPIYGIILLGSPLYDEFVTSFQVNYSPDRTGKVWKAVQTKEGYPQLFRGSVDRRTPVKAIFDTPIEATMVRVIPKSFHNEISVRFDLIGCADEETETTVAAVPAHTSSALDAQWEFLTTSAPVELCDEPMGVENGQMADSQIAVSSEKLLNLPKHGLSLNGSQAWQPLFNTPNEWVKFDFGGPVTLTGVKTSGGPNGWITAFKVYYSHDDQHWNPIHDQFGSEKVFLGNFDQTTKYVNAFSAPLRAKQLKIVPKKWTGDIQMQVEPIGCFEVYPVAVGEPMGTTVGPSQCQVCPGVDPSANPDDCKCDGALWWDGEDCGARAQCPCVSEGHVYPVGSSFEKESCEKCLCTLGGVDHCEQKKCPSCDEGLKSDVSTTCGCICKPCPAGQLLCPSSDICIDAKLWCDGVMDCPDDEINCLQTTTTVKPVDKAKLVECPAVACPDGFKIALKNAENTSPMFQMFGGRKNDMSRYFGAKGRRPAYQGKKTAPRKHPAGQKCAEFTCLPLTDDCLEPDIKCPDGYTIEIGAQIGGTKQCQSYKCVPPPKTDEICAVNGRTFETFDGLEYKFDVCEHVLVRDIIYEEWDVILVKNCTATCTRDLVIRHGNQLIKLFNDLTIEYNGYRYSAEQTSQIGAKNLAFVVSRLGDTLLFVSNYFGFWALWTKQGNVKVGVTDKLVEQVAGLCGYFDHNPMNDKRKPNGKQAKTSVALGDSWLVGDSAPCQPYVCPLHVQNRALKMCQLVREKVFSRCHQLVPDLDGWVSKCLETACACVEGGNGTRLEDARSDQKCRCDLLEQFVVECNLRQNGVEIEDWRLKMECPAKCDSPLVHQDCFHRRCEMSCGQLAAPDGCPVLPNLCFPGCYCPPGLVRKKDRCVEPKQCRDCECNVLPHLELISFDGGNFSVKSNCSYLMARDQGDQHQFEVYLSNAPCPQNLLKMCPNVLTLLANNHKITVSRGGKVLEAPHQVAIDDVAIETLPFENGWAQIGLLPARHVNILLPALQLELRVYYPTLGASLRVSSMQFGGKMEGVCGDCDRNPDNDDTGPTGAKMAPESWLDENECFEQKEIDCDKNDSHPCMGLLNGDKFGQCHLLLDPQLFLATCLHETCMAPLNVSCSSLETYALGCRAQGLCLDWHSELCPPKQCPPGQNYQLCGPKCPGTCETLGKKCENRLPVEGCFCAPGLFLKNATECVPENECFSCDEEGHFPGDNWQQDRCTNCTCDVTRSVKCETKECPILDAVCQEGFEALRVRKSEMECCERFACVPVNTTKADCVEPKPLQCGLDQLRKLEKRPDGCHDFVCECKPIEQCENVSLETTSSPQSESLPAGFEGQIDDSGCCPRLKLVCKKELCPRAPSCPQFHSLEEIQTVKADSCCPEFKCGPPKNKCLFTRKHTGAESGGERELSQIEETVMLLEMDSTVEDGPCRQCKCTYGPTNSTEVACTRMSCLKREQSSDYQNYLLEEQSRLNECCPQFKRTACRAPDGALHQPGDKWHGTDPCELLECRQTDGQIETVKNRVTCEKECELGAEYQEGAPGECCGRCQQVACVVEGGVKNIGDHWKSADFCEEYQCVRDNGTVLVSRKQETCPHLTADQRKDFIFTNRSISGECCAKQEPIACLVNGVRKDIGDVWADPDGDPCVTVQCLHSSMGGNDLTHQRTVSNCMEQCRPGWRYLLPVEDLCCGECVQVSCMVNGTEYAPGQTWPSADGCTTFECSAQGGQLTTNAHQETCPDISLCPDAHLVQDGCCTRCNMTAMAMRGEDECVPRAMDRERTVGLVAQQRDTHGHCANAEAIEGFTECEGACQSGTKFNAKTALHESMCNCCQAVRYSAVSVELRCADGYSFRKQVAVPSECACNGCGQVSDKPATKTKTKA